jgi:branched-chain amino acid transport system permease protein
MNPRIRTGLLAGILGLVMAIISGENIAIMAGMLSGLVAGLLVAQAEFHEDAVAGFRAASLAGLVAGGMTVIGELFRALVLDPLLGVEHNATTLLAWSLGALVVAALTAGIFGAVRTLKRPNDSIATYTLLGLLVVAYPWLDRAFDLRFMNEVIPVLVFVLMALGLNIVVGYAGLLDLGYAAFFAIGAYTTGMISSPGSPFGLSISFWIAIWVAAAVAAIFGIILGAPTLPLRGDYLAIVTLGFGEIVPIAANNLDKLTISILGIPILTDFNLTGGPKGINPINRPTFFGYEFRPDQPIPWYYLILTIMFISIFFIIRLRNSRLGRAWMAMREDELAAASMGIDLVNTKLLAFAMGATFSGFAGAFYGSYISAIFPSSFRFDVSVMLLCMVILGGMGNITGVIVGGLIIQLADRLFLPQLSQLIQKLIEASGTTALGDLNFASDFRLLMFGLTLVIMMLVRPEGLIPSQRIRMEMHAAEEDPTIAEHERTALSDVAETA